MEELLFINNIVTFRGNDYDFEETEKIDDLCVHVHMSGQIVALMGNYTMINGKLLLTADEIVAYLNNI